MLGAASAVIPPAIAALSLGLVGRRLLDARVSRNEGFNHGGNLLAAVLAGTLGQSLGYHWIFYLVCAFAVASAAIVTLVNPKEIDHEQARGGEDPANKGQPIPFRDLLRRRDLIIFLASVVLFHFGNAAMLPMAGQVLAQTHPGEDAIALSACIIAAQFVMVGVAWCVGQASARGVGRKPIFLVALAVLPVRGAIVRVHLQPLRGRRHSTARWGGGRHFRRDLGADRIRPHARHRPVQSRPRADGTLGRHWRHVEQRDRRLCRAMVRLSRGLPVSGSDRGLRIGVLLAADAGDEGHAAEPAAVGRAATRGGVMAALAASPWSVWGIAAMATAGVILRPFAWPEFIWAVTGAVLLIALNLLPAAEALAAVAKGTDVYLFLIGMMLLAELARQEGLFDWLAAKAAMACAADRRRRLFSLVFAVGTVVTVFLSNDATAVVLTPAVAAVIKAAKAKEALPYLFICAFIANAASFVLPISNPANLVIYGSHMPRLPHWLASYALPRCCRLSPPTWCCAGRNGSGCGSRWPP